MSDSWQARLPCTQMEAEAAALSDLVDLGSDLPTLVASEVDPKADPAQPGSWELLAYFVKKPSKQVLAQLKALVPSAGKTAWQLQRLDDEDWVTLSQTGLQPIRVGRFHIHTSEMPTSTEKGVRNLEVPAGLAFGTGHHETTHGCVAMLEKIKQRHGAARHILDLGTGTGLLAFAAMHLWPNAYATASDIDPLCGPVVDHNCVMNGIKQGVRRGELLMLIADGLDDPIVQARGPYDLVLANILAAPLIALAPEIHDVMLPQGRLVLSGLLRTQAKDVISAYRQCGFRLVDRIDDGDWSILYLRKRGHAWA